MIDKYKNARAFLVDTEDITFNWCASMQPTNPIYNNFTILKLKEELGVLLNQCDWKEAIDAPVNTQVWGYFPDGPAVGLAIKTKPGGKLNSMDNSFIATHFVYLPGVPE